MGEPSLKSEASHKRLSCAKVMRVNGRDVRDGDVFTICLNSYRASGTGGYDFYVGCRVVREIGTEMADLILDYFKEFKGSIPALQSDFHVI